MAMYSIRLDGDTRAMLRRIRSFSEIDKQGINAALAEGARESTLERFKQSKGPDGRRWKTSIRAAQEGGKTLIQSAQLRNSIHAKSDASGFAVGTNVKYAATHQFGEMCIRDRTKDAPEGILLPANKFIVHKYKARSGHTSRAGILRVVAWMYLFKNYDLKDWASFAEIYGLPLRLGKYAPGASDSDKASLMQALIQIGSDAAGIIPDGTSIDFITTEKVSLIHI